MNKQQGEQQARCQAIVEEAEKLTGMHGQWEFSYIWDCGYDGDGASTDGEWLIHKTAAITAAQWEYKRATIRYYLPTCALVTDERLLAVAVHELVHCLLSAIDTWLPNDDVVNKLNEYTTESITRAILHAAGRPLL